MEEKKNWYQSRTLWANVFVVVMALFKHFAVDGNGASVDESTVVALIGAINIGLRMVTKQAIK